MKCIVQSVHCLFVMLETMLLGQPQFGLNKSGKQTSACPDSDSGVLR